MALSEKAPTRRLEAVPTLRKQDASFPKGFVRALSKRAIMALPEEVPTREKIDI